VNAPGNVQFADRVADPSRTGDVEIGQPFYDISAWRPVTEVRFGNETRNSVRGPGFSNVDLSIFRHFPVGATRRLEARIEIFNLFNSPRFRIPTDANRTVGNPRFMQITEADQLFDRQIRLGFRFSF
jgi:TonB dependent receptor